MDYKEFLDAFKDFPEFEEDQEYFDVEMKYKELFGHLVPREILPSSVSSEQIKDAMKKSIDSGEDMVSEILHITLNDKYIY